MTDPHRPGTATPPATVGEGCVQRYDPEALTEEDGTEFPGAAELWERVQQDEVSAPEKPPSK